MLCLATILSASAQIPHIINYQGRLTAHGTNFTGIGQFKFALVNGSGTQSFWSHDSSSASGGEPIDAVNLPVVNGLFVVPLGDTTIANITTPIPPSVFANIDVRLRVWFQAGADPFQQLAVDQRIVSVGYAMVAATVLDGSITDRHLSSTAAINANKISGGDLAVDRLRVGTNNTLTGTGSTIAGGADNQVSADHAHIGGGQYNRVTDVGGIIGGGTNNLAGNADGIPINTPFTTVGGGCGNAASNVAATISGGRDNVANGSYATVPGGRNNKAQGNFSFAAGRRAVANHSGTFVWADSQEADFVSGANDAFLIRAANGVGINTTNPVTSLDVNGSSRISEQMTVQGRLGVGTENPQADLDVHGSVNIQGPLLQQGRVIAENGLLTGGFPTGIILPFGGPATNTPPGWMLCDGRALASGDYPNLFSVIGTNFGPGINAVTNFHLPDLRGRTTMGAGNAPSLSPRTLGTYLGEERHLLTITEMPAHSHSINDPGHTHPYTRVVNPGNDFGDDSSNQSFGTANTLSRTTGITINNTGGSQPHNIIQPSLVLNYIIKI